MTASEQRYLKKFNDLIKDDENCQILYKNKIVKQSSYFNEYSSMLMARPGGAKAFLDKIKSNEVRREKSYFCSTHNGVTSLGNTENKNFQWEIREILALYNSQSATLHLKLLDYQTPLKNTNKDNEKGIDLIGTDGKTLFILEYKRLESKESLLRSVLECYSYRRLINDGIKKFAEDFELPDADVVPGILMMKGSKQHKAFIKQTSDKPIIKLMEELGVKAFLIEPAEFVEFKEDDEMKKNLSSSKPIFNFKFDIYEIWA